MKMLQILRPKQTKKFSAFQKILQSLFQFFSVNIFKIIFMQQYTHTVLRSANKFFLGSFDTICSLHGYMRVLLMSYFHVHTSVTDDLCYLITT